MKFKYLFLLSIIIFIIFIIPQLFVLSKEYYFIGDRVSGMLNAQIKNGNLLTKNLYTSENQGRIFFPLSLFIPTPINTYIYLLGLIVILNQFLRQFVPLKKISFSLALICFYSGIGFFINKFINSSVDLWLPQANLFHSLLRSPSYVFNLFLLIISFHYYLLCYKNKKLIHIFLSSAFAAMMIFEQPSGIILFISVIFIHIFITENNLKSAIFKIKELIIIFTPSILSLFIYFYIVLSDINIRLWYSQVQNISPALPAYISGYGFVGLFAFKFLWKKELTDISYTDKFLLAWVCAAIFLLYFPSPWQTNFSLGFFIVIGILSTTEIEKFIFALARKIGFIRNFPNYFLYIIIILFLSLTNIYIIKNKINEYGDKENSLYFIHKSDRIALEWLKNNTNEKDIILSDAIYSPAIPVVSGRTVYFGNNIGEFITYNYEKKINEAKDFFFTFNDDKRRMFLKNKNISYFYLGKKASSAQDYKTWDKKSYLHKVYEGNGTKIFKFIDKDE